jgi:PAS domain S-box-containing protein
MDPQAPAVAEWWFRDLVTGSPDMLAALSESGRVTFASAACQELLGCAPTAVVGRPLVELTAPEDQGAVDRALKEIGPTTSGLALQVSLVRADGTRVAVELRGRVLRSDEGAVRGIVLVARDVTARKQHEDALRFASFAVDRFSDPAYLVQEDARIVYANDAASKMLGYTRAEFLELPIYELNADTPKAAWPAVWQALKDVGQRTFETHHRAKDGTVIPVEISANLVELDGKEWSCAFARDIRDRKELERRLRQAEKMEAIGALAGGVAHDFNNQLTSIMGYSEILREELGGDAQAASLVDNVLLSARRAADLTRQLLAFSRKGKYVVERVDVNQLVREVATVVSRTVDKKIEIQLSLESRSSVVDGDASQLQNAILNLALNARDAMPGGGVLRFFTGDVGADVSPGGEPTHGFQLGAGHHVEVRVADTGAGMDEVTQAHMFEPFFTTKEKGKGTGLGLAAVYGTVKSHRGALCVQSARGQGTTIHVYLPAAAAAGTAAEPEALAADRAGGLGSVKHVMVVDDDPAVRDVAQRLLQSLGCRTTAFADGVSCIEFYRRAFREVDAVLLDMVMPVMSGRETFLKLREINPAVIAVLASGYSLDSEAQSMIDEGVRGFVQKPYTRAALLEKLTEALDPLGFRRPRVD